MNNKELVEPLMVVAVRLGLGETTEMPLMVAALRKVADTLERRHATTEASDARN